MSDTIKWGILSTGGIARQFAEGLSLLPDAKLVAVGSRNQAAADEFGDLFNVPKRYPTYEALVNDPDIDVIYIGTPHIFHRDNMRLCLEAGKHVLCEKAFTINAAEAEEAINLAREKGLFLMEAMWTRFLPAVIKVRELLAEGVIGDVRLFQADFGFNLDFDASHRAYNPELGGGALLDVGIYPISFASMVFGTQPAEISSYAYLGQTGVDEVSAGTFRYPNGALAQFSGAVSIETTREAIIFGTKGHIRVHNPFWFPDTLTLTLRGQAPQVIDVPKQGNGYSYEADEVAKCIRAGQLESAIMPLDETLAIMRTLDSLRAQWGLKYPTE